MNILSIVDTFNGKPIGAGEVLMFCAVGFCLVIATLIVLIFLLILFSKVFGKIDSITLKKKSQPVTAVTSTAAEEAEEDEETVAAITAALIAFYDAGRSDGEAEVPPPFVIRSIKKN